MVRVCIHHPLNPEKSKKCMTLRDHQENWVTELQLPFLDDPGMISWALRNMSFDGDISDVAQRAIYEQVKVTYDKPSNINYHD